MPFIWDDLEWMLIDDEDKYDKSRFVVVRTLHVKLSTSLWQVMVSFRIDQFSVISLLMSQKYDFVVFLDKCHIHKNLYQMMLKFVC